MKCPVCPNTSVTPEQLTCDNCGADLTAVRRIAELPARWYNDALAHLRNGETDAAIAELQAAINVEDAPQFRRLLGKALWNAGRFAHARAQWEMIADDAEAQRLLAMEVPHDEPGNPWKIVAAVAALLIIGITIPSLLRSTAPKPRPPASQAAKPKPPVVAVSSSSSPLAPLAARLATHTAIRTESDDRGLHVVFRNGLFDSGSDLPSEAGELALRDLARELASAGMRLHVTVEGFTDPVQPPRGSRWSDNWSLAFSRAHAAVERMRADAGPGVSWSASSAGEAGAPYPNDNERNRTVVLHVAQRVGG